MTIQDKRCTNAVGIFAVRNPYNTVTTKHGSRETPVTTSYFRARACEFAKGKPIILMYDSIRFFYSPGPHGATTFSPARDIEP